MKKFVKKILNFALIFSLLISSFSLNVLDIAAEGEHKFLLKAYDWNPFDETGTEEEYANNSQISPGKVIKLSVYYIPGSDPDIMMQMAVKYDSTLVEPMYDGDVLYTETDMLTTYQGGIWPAIGTTASNKKKTNWSVTANDAPKYGLISILAEDSMQNKPLETEGVIIDLYFKVKDDATSLSKIIFEYDESRTKLTKYDDGTIRKVITEGINFNVYKELSSNTLLNTLTVKNNSKEYILEPMFVPNSETEKEYRTIVPNNISSVDISATTSDLSSTVLPAGLGTKNLNIGENNFNIIVQSESGTQDIYKLTIYRLNSDANLKTLSLTNDVNIGVFDSGKTSYSASIPYSIKSTNIIAKTNDAKATIMSGTGDFKFINTGTNLNIREIVVYAEDCKEEYASVLDNTCTSKTYTIQVSRENPSTNNYLSDLTISNKTITNFNKEQLEYNLPNVSNATTSLDINATVEDVGKSTIVSGIGKINLNVGNNTISVVVKAEDNTERIYKINVRRLSNDTSINKIILTIGTDSSRYCLINDGKCEINVPSNTTSFILNAEINKESTISPINGTEYQMTSIERIKNVNLVVTAEDGTQSEYIVIVERDKSSNNYLSDIKIDNESILEFNKEKSTYNLVVPGATESISISALVEDTDKAVITTNLNNRFNLNFGSNEIKILVTAENGDIRTYILNIERNKRVNAYLKDLKINDKSITGFSKDKTIYNINDVDYNISTLKVEGIAEDDLAIVEGNGIINLNTGLNTITLIVKAHDTNITEIYKINVNRKLNDDTGIKGINLAGIPAIKDGENYIVTVPNNITQINKSNLIVIVNDPKLETDKKANYSFNDIELLTTNVNNVVIVVTAEDGSVKNYTLIVTREKSDIALLSNIIVTNGNFLPHFSSNIFEYEITVPVDTTEFDVTTIKIDPNSKVVSGEGHYNISTSEKQIEVKVVSENEKVTNTYILNIKRTKSNINTLSNITVSEGTLSPKFSTNITSYMVNVDGNISSIDVTATLTDSRATIKSGTGMHSLEVGENDIVISVESESGNILNYNIKVIRAKKNNNDLLGIRIDGNEIEEFNSNKFEYDLGNVNYSKSKINVEAILSDSDASVTGTGDILLVTGDNEIILIVTAQNGDKKEYKLKVNRIKNNNANLDLLSVKNYAITPNFDKDILLYEINVEEEKNMLSKEEITAVLSDLNASISMPDNIELSTTVDNFYEITVTAEDGKTTKIYKIKVNRPKSSDTTLSDVKLTNAVLSPLLTKENREYTITIPYGNTEFTIEGIPNVSTTKVTGNGTYLKNDKIVRIITLSEDGSTDIYIFNIEEELNNDATLSNLSVTDYNFDKTFVSTINNYSIGNISYGTLKLKINATLTDKNASIKYYVGDNLSESNIVNISNILGQNIIKVEVTAADKTTKNTYNIYYNIVKSDNAYLKTLESSKGILNFDKNTYLYNLNLNNDITSVSFNIVTEDENANISINGEITSTPKKVDINNLIVGENNFEIIVIAQNGNKKTYKIVINRLGKQLSNDAYLSSLSIDNYNLDKEFNMNTFEYSIGEIPYSLGTLKVNAISNMKTSTITYYVDDVKQANNVLNIPNNNGFGKIVIEVTAEDGITTNRYKISYIKNASNNAYLSNIVPNVGKLDFSKTKYEYSIDVPNDTETISLNITTEDNTSSMKINGVSYTSPHQYIIPKLLIGNTEVIILVTAEDGTFLTYKITIIRKSNISETITSTEYGHTISNGYIKTVKINTLGLDLKNQLDNPNEYLQIWNSDETKKIDDNSIIATGYIVKLMINGVEKDRKIIVIKGDINGDGKIDITDSIGILGHYLNGLGSNKELKGPYFVAGDIVEDSEIDISDAISTLKYYLGH